ncbi:hypothetical protein [Novosphingobium humi]|uniref:Uncharacterized protein n=1 Tax=Novosphingobium humi TaxID=2282397 RepID=A0ABY7TZI2_9SPHN|nr:hypothetical protein [Novosphingobium humi]WCT78693.1 hypothetical protein PQ457_06935 [Novosphingobium humi]
MIGIMQSGTNSVVQLCLPFEGVQDRVRAAAEAGSVLFLAEGRRAMKRDDISDILVIRALKRCELQGPSSPGNSKGELRCIVNFNLKGFNPGGIIQITVSEGRLFVEDIRWDHKP